MEIANTSHWKQAITTINCFECSPGPGWGSKGRALRDGRRGRQKWFFILFIHFYCFLPSNSMCYSFCFILFFVFFHFYVDQCAYICGYPLLAIHQLVTSPNIMWCTKYQYNINQKKKKKWSIWASKSQSETKRVFFLAKVNRSSSDQSGMSGSYLWAGECGRGLGVFGNTEVGVRAVEEEVFRSGT